VPRSPGPCGGIAVAYNGKQESRSKNNNNPQRAYTAAVRLYEYEHAQ
jgi:hypothetical protein